MQQLALLVCLCCISLFTFSKAATLDLRDHDWSEGSIHSLQGNWDFYWQQLILPTPSDSKPKAQPNTGSVLFPVPGAWNAPPEGYVSFPGFGYATYQLSILIPPQSSNLFIAIPDMASAYKLFNHGQLIAKNGIVGTQKDLEVPAYSPKYVALQALDGKLDLVLQTSNFHYQWGGVWYPLKLTDSTGIYELREKPIIQSMLSATVLIAASLFGLFIFFSRPKEKTLLYFSLLCLVMGLRRLLIDERILYLYFGEHWTLLQSLENISTYLAFPLFVSYFSHRFPVKYSQQAIFASWIISIPFCTLALTTNVSFYTTLNIPYQICIIFSLPYIFFIYSKCLIEKRRGARTFGLGLAIFILTVFNDILAYSYIIHTPNLSHLGILTFVIFQGIDLAKSYLHNFKKIEDMSSSLQHKNQELMKIDAFKDEFLATTSHELRTPLHAISGLADHLLNSTTSLKLEQQHKLDLIYSSSRRLGSLVNDIVDFASIKHGNLTLTKKPIDLKALSNTVVDTLSPLISGRDICLSANITPDAQFVLADENRLQQILFNLLGNAIKFTEEGIIQVNAHAKSSHVTIEIIDSGIGIAPDKYNLLFEPFQHFDETKDMLHSGSGLGLSISRQLVRLHGGDLKVESNINAGTKIEFSLERSEAPKLSSKSISTPSISTPPTSSLDTHQHTHPALTPYTREKDSVEAISENNSINQDIKHAHIFVVDDEEVNLELVHAQLHSAAYKVDCFPSGALLLERLTQQIPDLILLDLMMPALSGLEVCRTIRAQHDSYELPIMMLTARYQVNDIVDCLSAGANDYLIKPYHKKELLARVSSQLSARSFWFSRQENQILKQEIDHRKALEEKLSIANNRLLNALDITDKCILLLSKELDILYSNQPALSFLNTQKESILGKPLSDILAEDSVTKVKHSCSNTNSSFSLSIHDQNLGDVGISVHPFQEKGEQYYALVVQAEQGLTKSLIQNLTDELASSRDKFAQIEQALKQIPLINEQESVDVPDHQARRMLLIKLLRESISAWERYTLKNKAELAEDSRCWKVYLDGTTAKTRTLDRYLNERTLPANPRWQLVIRTAQYVIEHCDLTPEDNEKLNSMILTLDKSYS